MIPTLLTNEAPSSPTTTLRTACTSVDVTEALWCSEFGGKATPGVRGSRERMQTSRCFEEAAEIDEH
jgi:hypothetical protein